MVLLKVAHYLETLLLHHFGLLFLPQLIFLPLQTQLSAFLSHNFLFHFLLFSWTLTCISLDRQSM